MASFLRDTPKGRTAFRLDKPVMLIGRDAHCDLVVREPSVAPRHAILRRDRGAFRLVDLGSKEGTRINGAVLAPKMPSTLHAGDLVQFGRLVLIFHEGTPVPAAVPPRPPRKRTGLSTTGLAALAVGAAVLAAAAWFFLFRHGETKKPPPPAPAAGPAPAVASKPASEPDRAAPPPEPEPPPEPKKTIQPPPGPERAPKGSLPPSSLCDARLYPDLVETKKGGFFALKITGLFDDRIEGVGADKRLYSLPRATIARVMDRVDIRRRAEARLASLAPGDVAGRRELGRWCLQRKEEKVARAVVSDLLARDPKDAVALALSKEMGGKGR